MLFVGAHAPPSTLLRDSPGDSDRREDGGDEDVTAQAHAAWYPNSKQQKRSSEVDARGCFGSGRL